MPHQQSVLLDCEYFPCIAWFSAYVNKDHVRIEQYDFFERSSLRNRCYIAGPNGKLALSVPLEGGRNRQGIMKDVKIYNNGKWQQQQWKTLQSCYNRSAFFEYFKDDYARFFQKKFIYLVDLNLETIRLLLGHLQIAKEFLCTSSYAAIAAEGETDNRNAFQKKNINAVSGLKYIQTFEDHYGFIDGLSMLDLLFCAGNHASQWLVSDKK